MNNGDLLAMTLQAGVPIEIARLQRFGGPKRDDWERARQYGATLAEKGDTLQFGSKKKGEAAALMTGLIRAVAVLAFTPGGMTIFGVTFEAKVRR